MMPPLLNAARVRGQLSTGDPWAAVWRIVRARLVVLGLLLLLCFAGLFILSVLSGIVASVLGPIVAEPQFAPLIKHVEAPTPIDILLGAMTIDLVGLEAGRRSYRALVKRLSRDSTGYDDRRRAFPHRTVWEWALPILLLGTTFLVTVVVALFIAAAVIGTPERTPTRTMALYEGPIVLASLTFYYGVLTVLYRAQRTIMELRAQLGDTLATLYKTREELHRAREALQAVRESRRRGVSKRR